MKTQETRTGFGTPAFSADAGVGEAAYTTVRTCLSEVRRYQVLFGAPVRIDPVTNTAELQEAVYWFAAGMRFGLDLWSRNPRGTVRWQCFVCEAIGPGISAARVATVIPAARVLLATRGVAQSRLFLTWLRLREKDGFDALQCPAEAFEAVHFRLQGVRASGAKPRVLGGLGIGR